MADIVHKLNAIETLIRQGSIAQAATEIRNLHRKRVPGRLACRFAELARRADLAPLGLSALYPIVRRPGLPAQGTPREIAEYAACLVRIGATDEAVSLLKPLTELAPIASLYLALAYINLLNNRAAAEHLTVFLARPEIDAYWRSIATYNLAACYTAMENPERSQPLVAELLEYATKEKLNFLLAACYELTAQNQIIATDYNQALATLENAEIILANSPSREAFFVKKWKTIAQWKRASHSEEVRPLWAAIRKEAATRKSWETLRQLDYFEFQVTQDPKLFGKLFYGTRFEEFKTKLTRWSKQGQPSDSFLFPRSEGQKILDVTSGLISPSDKAFARSEGLAHRTLQALTSDLYRPFRIPTLHAMIYPNEHYHPTGAKYRVHFAIQELRASFKKHGLHIKVISLGQEYQLEAMKDTVLRLSENRSAFGLDWDRLFTAFSGREFTMREAAAELQLNDRAMQRLLVDWIAIHACLKLGKGPSTRYQLVDPATKSAQSA